MADQVAPGHRAAKVQNARWCRQQWGSAREQKRQLQACPIHRGGGCHPPVATRGHQYAPWAIKTTERSTQGREIDIARKNRSADPAEILSVVALPIGTLKLMLTRCPIGTRITAPAAARYRSRTIARCASRMEPAVRGARIEPTIITPGSKRLFLPPKAHNIPDRQTVLAIETLLRGTEFLDAETGG
jgi:hypothetical protein